MPRIERDDNRYASLWNITPIRVEHATQQCHEASPVLVSFAKGGFVGWQCSTCKKEFPLESTEFEVLSLVANCPKCKQKMALKKYQNYSVACDKCDIYVWLGDLLPKGA